MIEDPLRSLRFLTNTDIKRKRRAFTQDELRRLITNTEASGVSLWGLSPKQRSMLYLVAAFTGLRAHELSSLTRQSFDLDRKTVTVQAGYSKRRREDVLPLNASLLTKLEPWIVTIEDDGLLWDGAWSSASSSHVMRMMKIDLKRAGIEYVVGGRYADFHALRHTFISSLARSGVHPSKAKDLARHSTITLTMDVYSHVETEALRSAVDTLTY
jgi:integrase/recombinase XerD